VENSLRARREALGLTAFEVAALAGLPVERILRAEFGMEVPRHGDVARISAAYCLHPETYLRLALDEADRLNA
jgi:hypothetical protein